MTRQIRLMPGKGSGRPLLLAHGPNVIGRSNDCDHQLEAATVSEKHCRIDCSPSSVMIRDLGSTNGTFVNSEQITRTMLDPGDIIKIGAFKFQVAISDVAPDPVVATPKPKDEDFDLSKEDSWMDGLQSAEEKGTTDFEVETPSGTTDSDVDMVPAASDAVAQHIVPEAPSPLPVEPVQPKPVQQTAPAAVVPPAVQPQPIQPQVSSVSPVAVAQAAAIAKAKAASRPMKEPRDWSGVIELVTEHPKAIFTIVAGLLVAAVFLVPWGSFFGPNDLELCEFYESAFTEIVMRRDSNTSLSATDREELTNRVMAQHNEYLPLLESPYASTTAKLLVMAGRDNLAELLQSDEKGSKAERVYRQKVVAARKILGGTSVLAALETAEEVEKRVAGEAAIEKAMAEMMD